MVATRLSNSIGLASNSSHPVAMACSSAEPVDGPELLNDRREVFRRYVVLPKGADIALALWVLHA
jgi:hypothetical protein